MNAKDRIVLGRVHEVLRKIASDTPFNPSDIDALSTGNRRASVAAGHLYSALSCLEFGDDPEEDLSLAEAVYGVKNERT